MKRPVRQILIEELFAAAVKVAEAYHLSLNRPDSNPYAFAHGWLSNAMVRGDSIKALQEQLDIARATEKQFLEDAAKRLAA